MYKIIYSQKSKEQLDIFINSYKGTFIQLFIDSGIQDVERIISNYESIGDTFYIGIRDKIGEKITAEKVLGRKMNGEGDSYSLIFRERSFLIIIDYTEDTESKTRYIENIIFTRK